MGYESRFERFEAAGPDGSVRQVEFRRAGFLTAGDRPELYFFSSTTSGLGEEIVVGISGSALRSFERTRRCLTREEKIDVAGAMLRGAIEAGRPLDSGNLLIREDELAAIAGALGIPA